MRRFARLTAIAVLLILCLLEAASRYMLDYSLKPENRGKDLEGSYAFMYERYPYLHPWVDSLRQASALCDTFVRAADGTRLHALYVRAVPASTRTAVIVHGYTDNAIRMLMIGHLYSHELGYNILLPDLRYSGLSEGDHFQMGWNDRTDLLQWMDVAHSLYGDSTTLVVHGISMGAATTMMASGELPQRPYVRCYVADCGYTSVWDEFQHQLKEQFHLPAFPLLYTTDWLCRQKYGWGFREASALKQVARCPLPMLFIHGEADTFVPTTMLLDLYQAKPAPKDLWIAPDSEHALSYRDHTQEYVRRVRIFTEKYM